MKNHSNIVELQRKCPLCGSSQAYFLHKMKYLESADIFLTGGTGFFGKSILSMLQRGFLPDASLTILSREPERFLERHPEFRGMKRVEFLAGDVRDFPFPDRRFDCMIHAATPAVVSLPPGEMKDIVLRGNERVLAFAEHCGARRLLLTSSGAVYGVQPPELEYIPEDFPCSPVTEYGIAKLEAEQKCLASGIPTVIARCFAFTGPYLDRNVHFAIGNFIRDCLSGKDIVIQGDGTPFRSYLHSDDLAEWLFSLLFHGTPGQVYNVGSDQAVSIRELAETVWRVLGAENQIRVLKKVEPDAKPSRYVPDISKIQKELGVSVKIGLEEAIRKSLRLGERP